MGIGPARHRAGRFSISDHLRRHQQTERRLPRGKARLQLLRVEREHRPRPRVVAAHAFRAARESPRLLASSARDGRVGDLQRRVRSVGGHEVGVGLGVVPTIGGRLPSLFVEMEQLRLDPAPRRRRSRPHLERQGLHQDGVLREPAVHDAVRPRNREPALRGRVVVPHRGVDGVGLDAGRRGLLGGVAEDPGGGQFPRVIRRRRGFVVGHEPVDAGRAVVVEHQDLAVRRLGEADDLHRGVAQLLARHGARSVVAQRPDLPGRVVAVDVRALQPWHPFSAVEQSAGDARRLAVRMRRDRCRDRRGRLDPAMDPLRSFDGRPAAVVAAGHPMDHLPQFPADITDPERAVGTEVHPPRIAEPVGPDLRPCTGPRHERIVRRHAVEPPAVRVVHVDPEDGRHQVAQVLPGGQRVGRLGGARVAERGVEHAVRTEPHAGAFVAAAARSDDDGLAGEVELGRGAAAHGVAGQGPAVGAADVVAEDGEEQAVRREARMEREARELRQPRMQVVEIRDQFGGCRRRVVLERHQPTADQADEPAPRGRFIGEVDRLGELEAREHPLDAAGRRGLRRTDDARCRPRRAIR